MLEPPELRVRANRSTTDQSGLEPIESALSVVIGRRLKLSSALHVLTGPCFETSRQGKMLELTFSRKTPMAEHLITVRLMHGIHHAVSSSELISNSTLIIW
jgi:hypothetical protein